MISNVILIAALAFAGFVIYGFYRRYQQATGTTWQRLLTAARGSASVLWSYIVAAGGYLMTWSVNAADAFNLPEVRDFIQQHLTPEMFGVTLLVVALIGYIARRRTL